jgi:Uma2 family endonuclease
MSIIAESNRMNGVVGHWPGSVSVAALPHRKISVAEYHSLIEGGVFADGERLELWEGEFIEMSPIGKRHLSCVDQLTEIFGEFLRKKAIVRVQGSIVLDDFSEPEPDLSILARREDFYRNTNATAKDVLMIIEVAESSGSYDREFKFPRYAANDIKEAWLIDLDNGTIEIHTDPNPEGYNSVQILTHGQSVQSNTFPEIEIPVSQLLG